MAIFRTKRRGRISASAASTVAASVAWTLVLQAQSVQAGAMTVQAVAPADALFQIRRDRGVRRRSNVGSCGSDRVDWTLLDNQSVIGDLSSWAGR
jgi:hypothetical protein